MPQFLRTFCACAISLFYQAADRKNCQKNFRKTLEFTPEILYNKYMISLVSGKNFHPGFPMYIIWYIGGERNAVSNIIRDLFRFAPLYAYMCIKTAVRYPHSFFIFRLQKGYRL